MEASSRADDFIPAGLASFGIEADEVELAVMGAAHAMFWPAILELLALDTGDVEPERGPDLSERRRRAMSDALDLSLRGQAAAIAAGEVDPASCSTARWRGSRSATRRSTPSSRPSPSARARCSTPRPAGPLRGVPVVIKDEWPLPWRAQRFGAAEMLAPTAPGESGPYRALRDAGAVIVGVGNMHELGAGSTGNVSVYGPGPQPLGHRALPGRLLERPRGRRRRPPRRRRGRRRRGRLDPLPRRLLRPDRAEADLRPLGDGGPPHGGALDHDRLRAALRRRRRLPAARLGPVRRGAQRRASAAGLRIGVVRGAVTEDVAPAVREACEEAIRALCGETGGEVRRGRAGRPRTGDAGRRADRQHRGPRRPQPQRLNQLDPELSPIGRGLLKYRMLLPAAAAVKARQVRTLMRRRLAAAFAEVDVIAWPTVPAVAPPLRGAAGRAALGHAHRRPGQRARRRRSPT